MGLLASFIGRHIQKFALVCIMQMFLYMTCHNAVIESLAPATTPVQPNNDRSVAICVIQKGGIPYLEEWARYHIAVGFDKIYIYDNSDDFELQNWNASIPTFLQDRTTIQHFPGETKQIKAYKHCWESIQRDKLHDWIAFFDIDEFFVIRKPQRYQRVMDLLDDLPEDQLGLAVNWVNIGLNNLTNYEDIPVTLRFQMRSENATAPNVKTIVRSHVSPKIRNSHYVFYKENKRTYAYKTRDTAGNVVKKIFNDHLTTDTAALYHYITKSMEEYRQRCSRGDVYIQKKDWKNLLPCRESDDEIKDGLVREKGLSMNERVFDDLPWRLLMDRDPDYTRRFAPL